MRILERRIRGDLEDIDTFDDLMISSSTSIGTASSSIIDNLNIVSSSNNKLRKFERTRLKKAAKELEEYDDSDEEEPGTNSIEVDSNIDASTTTTSISTSSNAIEVKDISVTLSSDEMMKRDEDNTAEKISKPSKTRLSARDKRLLKRGIILRLI